MTPFLPHPEPSHLPISPSPCVVALAGRFVRLSAPEPALKKFVLRWWYLFLFIFTFEQGPYACACLSVLPPLFVCNPGDVRPGVGCKQVLLRLRAALVYLTRAQINERTCGCILRSFFIYGQGLYWGLDRCLVIVTSGWLACLFLSWICPTCFRVAHIERDVLPHASGIPDRWVKKWINHIYSARRKIMAMYSVLCMASTFFSKCYDFCWLAANYFVFYDL
jgi:hypothetical protein